jgi:hypothetical protein
MRTEIRLIKTGTYEARVSYFFDWEEIRAA